MSLIHELRRGDVFGGVQLPWREACLCDECGEKTEHGDHAKAEQELRFHVASSAVCICLAEYISNYKYFQSVTTTPIAGNSAAYKQPMPQLCSAL
jgi:hypothetical protein